MLTNVHSWLANIYHFAHRSCCFMVSFSYRHRRRRISRAQAKACYARLYYTYVNNEIIITYRTLYTVQWLLQMRKLCFTVWKTYSVHERPDRNPACPSLRIFSIASLSRFKTTEQKSLPATDNGVMPCQLLQSLRFPFFGNLTPFSQSTGTMSCFPTGDEKPG